MTRKKKDVKKVGAIELSMSTIVILVLAMVALIGGIILLTNIFKSGIDAIKSIDAGVEKAIKDAFADENKKLIFFPSEGKISIKTRTPDEGFAFSVRNTDIEDHDYIYNIYVDPSYDIRGKCKISATEAEGWLWSDSGSLSIPKGSIMDSPELVLFNIPDGAPPCQIRYKMDVNKKGGSLYVSGKIYLTIKAR